MSEQPLLDQVWVVVDHAVYYTRQNKFLKCLFLRREDSDSEIIQVEQNACVLATSGSVAA